MAQGPRDGIQKVAQSKTRIVAIHEVFTDIASLIIMIP